MTRIAMRFALGLAGSTLCLVPIECQATTCSVVSATGIAFGTYLPLAGMMDDAAGTITVRCTGGAVPEAVSYSLAVTPGSGGTFANRRINNGSATLHDQLYIDPTHRQVWGDGTGGTFVVTQPPFLIPAYASTTHSYTIYGRIQGRQAVRPGMYTEMIPIALNY